MSAWEIAALLREAEQVRNDWQLENGERLARLENIRAQVAARGGDPSAVAAYAVPGTAAARATRTSKPAAARRKAGE